VEFEIRPRSGPALGLRELWEYRELFYFFTWRDIKVKYKQTVLGFLWTVLQPLVMTFIFAYFIGRAFTSYTTVELPYDIFALSGLVIWGIFSTGLNNAGNSMVTNANIIKKIYFPRLIIPVSAVLVGLFDFVLACAVFIVYSLIKGQELRAEALICFPAAAILACIATLGCGSLLAALNVKYRDFRYVIPFLVQLLFFLTPVIYPVKIIEKPLFSWIIGLNPMTAPVEIFRTGLTGAPLSEHCVISICSSVFFLLVGLFYFRKTEAYFADLA
jgi:lipopolysaccharide transport system permease protein